jgi:hypothetical protein
VGVVALVRVGVGRANGLDGGHLTEALALVRGLGGRVTGGVRAWLVAGAAAGAWLGRFEDGHLA